MAEGEKLSCSELKKLQLFRRKNKSFNVKSSSTLNYPNLGSNKNETDGSFLKNPFSKTESTNNCNIVKHNIIPEKNIFNSNVPQRSFYDTELSNSFSKPEIFYETVQPKNSKPKSSIVEKSLKTSITIESDLSFADWNVKFSDPIYLMQSMKDSTNNNLITYYRYPDVALPLNQKKNIHKALSNNGKTLSTSEDNLIWYRMFSDKWRKALLSAFDTLKYGFINSFYFVQENLTILFERSPHDLIFRAYLQLTSLALKEDLNINGIEYKILNKNSSNNDNKEIVSSVYKIESVGEIDSTEDCSSDPQIYIPEIYVKRAKIFFTKEDIVVEGGISLAELVDFLINQKDRNSHAILPEIYSPGPFIHGTLRRNNFIFSGPCKGFNGNEFYHLKITDIIFPGSLDALLNELKLSGHSVSITAQSESNTDFLSAYKHDI